jgi:arylsulfatase
MKIRNAQLTGLFIAILTSLTWAAEDRPNILLIVADDLGYTDLGIYGGDINTPNIDQLAKDGLLFTQFHTAPSCAPTRAMLLSGNNNHVAGMARQSSDGILGTPVRGYEASLSERIVPFPRLLQEVGYNTYTVGKWHLGTDPQHRPNTAGFTRSWNLLHGAGNFFNAIGFREGGSIYAEDGELVDYPQGRYATEFYTDKLMEFIEESNGDGKPFFAFAAYTSPHWPLQVPDDYLGKYQGQYAMGYDRLREERFLAAKRAGIVPDSADLPPRNEGITHWDDLSSEEQRRESRKMELYAAMVENLDFHVGRLIKHLQDLGKFENTLIIFMADNGAAGEDFYHRGPFAEYVRTHYDNAYDNMGKANSFVSYGPQWAEAGSAPFSLYKTFTREGGMTVPMIASGKGVDQRGSMTSTYATVMDLAPTFLELGKTEYPQDEAISPIHGESMVGLLSGNAQSIHHDDYVTTLFHHGRAFVRQAKWKLVSIDRPFDESKMELFDLEADPGETTDLSEANPEQYQHMLNLWRTERVKMGIILPQDL